MCLIIAPGRDGQKALLPKSVFDFAYNRNNDGFGAMWTEDGRVKHFKTLGLTSTEVYDQMQEQSERHEDIIFHMRLKTHGKTIPALCHPFRILNKGRHGHDLFFMHNGILGAFGNDLSYGQSDTTVFKDKILVPLLTRDPDALDDPATMKSIEQLTMGSRLIFLRGDGKVWRTAESTWNNRYGLTLSNTYMLPAAQATPIIPSLGRPDMVPSGDPAVYSHYRIINREGYAKGAWCHNLGNGLLRAENGLMYRDQGINETIYHIMHHIPKDQEFRYTSSIADALDDDLPWKDDDDDEEDPLVWKDPGFSKTTTVGSAVANMDEKLRYARIVHNTHGGSVEVREQLIGDLLGMGEDEMKSFIKEDADTANVIMAELVEIILQMNDVFLADEELSEFAFDADDLIARGSFGNHRESMKSISDARTARYRALLEEKRKEKEEAVTVDNKKKKAI